jgi:DNA-binding transcriptional LysR family regulator
MTGQESASSSKPAGRADAVLDAHPPSPRTPRISLRQWRILQAVVDHGGFAQASDFLHLSQSAISYSLAKMQEQLGVPLLRIEGRRAHLTEMGHAILARSRRLIKKANEIEAFASALERGWEPEIRLVVDSAFPSSLMMRALKAFAQSGNGTAVLLSEAPGPGAEELLLQGSADLAIGAQVPTGFLGTPLLEAEYVAVIAPDHPLLGLGREITLADLEGVTQILVRDSEKPERRNTPGQCFHQGPCWKVAHFDVAVTAVREGHGFAWLLKHRIQDLLDRRVLVPLPLQSGHVDRTTLYLIPGGYRSNNPGPAVRHLVDIIHGVVAEERRQ